MQVRKRTRFARPSCAVLLALVLAVVACGPAPDLEPTVVPTREADVSPTATLPPTPPAAGLPYSPTPHPDDVHQAQGAGRWYPADPLTLQANVGIYVNQAEIEALPGTLRAVIVPHAGYLYSGAVAGHSFRAMKEAGCAGHTIAVIGDTHTGSGSAAIAVWAAGAFKTPLGTLPVDEVLAQALVDADPRIEFDRRAFEAEHPVENQLPFIQEVCPGAKIVPVVIRQPSLQNARLLADALVAAFDDQSTGSGALIVASTDLSHYHPYDQARKMDEVALQAIASLDPQAVADSPRRCAELGLGGENPLTMCSQGSVMAALITARQMGADRATVLHYANSGDVPIGDRRGVVGYGAVALWQSQDGGSPPASDSPLTNTQSPLSYPKDPIPLTPESQEELLALARRTIAQFLETETFPAYHTDDPALLQPMGAYVTYEQDGLLRGCLGRLEGDRPAYLNVQYAAVAAALADSRFPPVSREELEGLTLEITLLEPMQLATGPDEIEVGRDGVLMRLGEDKGALYLPQVALDQGWDLEEMLVNLSRKAGLGDDAWQGEEARFYLFGGQWFGEEE